MHQRVRGFHDHQAARERDVPWWPNNVLYGVGSVTPHSS